MMTIYHNGTFIDEDTLHVDATDRGLTLGDGIFDTLLAVDGAPVHADEHFNRLQHGASIMGISFTLDFKNTISALLDKNDFTAGRYAIRTTITRGSGMRGLAIPENAQPLVIMRASPAPAEKPPAKMIIAQSVRRNEFSPLSKIKSLNYGDSILALKEAQEKGADDAILLNTAGHVACATAGNIFIVEGGQIITPPLDDGVLDGITRKILIKKSGAREESFDTERLMNADSIFITNSVIGIRPVTSLNGADFKAFELLEAVA